MARLWKRVDGEPYMVNPRLGVLALQALNPPKRRKTMAKHKYGARHMAWVRSFKKNKHRRKYRRNPYPLAGTIQALGNPRRKHRRHKMNPHKRRHYRHNPGGFFRGALGLPPIMPVLYGFGGFAGTAMVQGFVDTLVPLSIKNNADGTPSMLVKYGEIIGSIFIVSYAAKMLNRGAAAFAAVGGGIYAAQQAAHDFLPNTIPGMHSYTPLKSYTPLFPSSSMGRLGQSSVAPGTGGGFPQLATRRSMPNLAAPDFGFANSANFLDDGGMDVVQNRFNRFA